MSRTLSVARHSRARRCRCAGVVAVSGKLDGLRNLRQEVVE